MREGGVGTIVVGCDYESSKRAIELAQQEHHVWACVGMHPNDPSCDTQALFERSDFTGLVGAKKANGTPAVVAVGECGLDYFRLDPSSTNYPVEVARQRQSFRNQIEWALELDLPLMLHVRPSRGSIDAHNDALAVLTEYAARPTGGRRRGVLRGTSHFFTSTIAVAERYLGLGFHISFPGVVTFAKELADVVREVPLNRILLETDSPYAAPVPYRGQQNEPVRVTNIATTIAAVKGVSDDDVAHATTANARALFGL